MLKYQNLTKSFKRYKLLNDISLGLDNGSVILLRGENGAGKTTLLKILCGLEQPDTCKVDFGSGQMDWRRCRAQLQKQIMYLHQQPYLFDGDVRRNLNLALPRGLTKSQRDEHISRGLSWARLENKNSAPAKTLSGGEMQRIALARAYLRTAKFLLLDEPIANLDADAQAQTLELLHRLKHAGTAILIASHQRKIFTPLIDRRILLVGGSIVDDRDA